MNRRDSVLALLAMVASGNLRALRAESGHRPYRIALVPDFEPVWAKRILKNLTGPLRKWGRIEGRDYVIFRSGVFYGPDTKPALDRALEAKADLIITWNLGYAMDAHKRAKNVPVVMWISGFPVQGGVARSLAKPGMNVTGMTIYAGGEVFGKLVQLVHEAKPSVRRVGFFMSYVPPFHSRVETDLIIRGARDAAGRLDLDLRVFEIAQPRDVDDAFASVVADGVEALVLTGGAPVMPRRHDIAQFAIEKRLPAIADTPSWYGLEPKPLLAYYAPGDLLMRQAASYVERILWKGAKPGDLPIQLPARFKLLVNLKTAKAIGCSVPPALLLRADEVEE